MSGSHREVLPMTESEVITSPFNANQANSSETGKLAQLPIRVAQILNRMDSGGIEAVVLNYYRHIDRNEVQFDFYYAEESTLPQQHELEQLGAGLYPIPPYSRPFAYHKALYTAFKQCGYKIVHAHLSTMSVFTLFAAWQAGVPVRICHNHSTAHWGEGVKTLLKYILRPFNKIFATDWFACGEKAGRWMYGNRAFDDGKVTIMPNAIDVEKFAYDANARIRLRRELGIPLDAFVVGHVGRFTYAKNHMFLLSVFSELLKIKPDAFLLLVGEGTLEKQIQKRVRKMNLQNRVIFTGVRADVNKMYSVMDSFCMPSFYEGLGLTAWEAQANGLPCVLASSLSQEVLQADQVYFTSLQIPAKLWAEKLVEKRNWMGKCTVPNIQNSAKKMQQYYIELISVC